MTHLSRYKVFDFDLSFRSSELKQDAVQSSMDVEQLEHKVPESLFSYLADLGSMTVWERTLATEWQFAKLDDGLWLRVYFFNGDITEEGVSAVCAGLVEKIKVVATA